MVKLAMDSQFRGYYNSTMSGIKVNDETLSVLPDHSIAKGSKLDTNNIFLNQNYLNIPSVPPDLTNPSSLAPSSSSVNVEGDSQEDCDFSDVVLKYINKMLMEEDMEDKTCMLHESSALQAAEKALYDVIGEKYPPSTDHERTSFVDQFLDYPNETDAENCNNGNSFSCTTSNDIVVKNPGKNCELGYSHVASRTNSHSSFTSSNSGGTTIEGFVNSPVSTLWVPDLLNESESVVQFRRGVEDAKKFLPNGNAVFVDLENDESVVQFRRGVGVEDARKFLPNGNAVFVDLENDESGVQFRRGVGVEDSRKFLPNGNAVFVDLENDESVVQFRRGVGVEDSRKFLPNGNAVFVDLENDGSLLKEPKEEAENMVVNVDEKHTSECIIDELRGKKNRHPEDLDLEEGRSNKQSAAYAETTVRSELFDLVLLCNGGKSESDLRESLQNKANKNLQQNGHSKGSNGGKVRGKKQGGKRDLVDLRTLLTLCAQAVAANDQMTSNELLKQIREHSSPTGDGMQRMAHYFANGLEARLAGYGTKIYTTFNSWATSAADILKAYHLLLAVCPFMKLSNFFSNKTIMHVSEKSTRLHIIDFGILYGFQWPGLIERLSSRPCGPPKLRITGIDFPQPGFRPAQRVEETGRRLKNYAETFKVPFKFNAIAQNWETIQIEDLDIKDDEVLVVNCKYWFRNLFDETVMAEECPRNSVLNLIRKMNPAIFIQVIVNGAYNAPFFISRFREALFHFSSLFDMLEANIPREIPERMLIERELFGREAMNVIACEGAERIERPETYRQWQIRNLRAGFVQLPLNREIMKMAKDRVKTTYHKDFVIDEDGHWMLQGWKGRISYAMSSWRPAY